MKPLAVGSKIGILGGGQLGRLLSLAAARLGFEVSIYCPEADCPAARISPHHICEAYANTDALSQWAKSCDVITYEFENVPVATVDCLQAAGARVRPGALALEKSQDRVIEKTFLSSDCAIPTAPFESIDHADQIGAALERLGQHAILKTRRDGYDGKGQARLAQGDDYASAHKALAHAPCILEALVPFKTEISIVIARTATGEIRAYDAPRNQHVNGILRQSSVPCALPPAVTQMAAHAAERLCHALDYIGVLALEFFVLEDGRLLANEFAPRVHNSGHWTPEACTTGQFEQHIRAICDWPLGEVTRFHDVEMYNLLGDEALTLSADQLADSALTLYGKRIAKPGRKMGHLVKRV